MDPRDLDTNRIAADVAYACSPMFKSAMPVEQAEETIVTISDSVHVALTPIAEACFALSDRLDAITLRD